MNKGYGKIEKGKMIYAPDVLAVDGKQIITPNEEDYLKAGWLKVKIGVELSCKEGYEISKNYRVVEDETGKYIECVREYIKLPEIEPSENELQAQAMLQLAKIQVEEITDDEKAVAVKELYDEWDGNGIEYKENTYKRYKDELYKVLQNHTSQPDWTPDTAHSLFVVVGKPGEGTKENPIKWVNGMIAKKDKYYTDKGGVYLCIEDSKIGLYEYQKDLARYFKSIAR